MKQSQVADLASFSREDGQLGDAVEIMEIRGATRPLGAKDVIVRSPSTVYKEL
jgi:hypothetical protein